MPEEDRYHCFVSISLRRLIFWLVFGAISAGLVILTINILSVRYAGPDQDYEHNVTYYPTDSRLIPVSNILCDKLRFNIDLPSEEGYEATLYLFNTSLQLTSENLLQTNMAMLYQDYKHYLLRGSNFSYSACLFKKDSKKPSFTSYIIKGSKNFKKWKKGGGKVEHQGKVTTLCEAGNDTSSYSVESDDFYYLVFQTENEEVSWALNVSVNFERARYVMDNSSLIDKCSLGSLDFNNVCSMKVPLSGSSTALLTIVSSDPVDFHWSDQVTVNAFCSSRIWVYVVISLGSVLVVVLFFVVFISLCCCISKRKKKAISSLSEDAVVGTKYSVNTPLLKDGAKPPPPGPTDVQNSSTFYGSNSDPPA